MTEHLRPCPFCGGDDLTTERPASNPVGCDNCGLYVATPEDWNERALAPALDVVLEAVEAWTTRGHDPADAMRRNMTLGLLRALRDAHSPTVSVLDFGAQSDTGEAERGS